MVWIVPPPSHSAWFSRLDWYLNWQMCKGQAHRCSPPPAEMFRVAEEHGIEIEIPEVVKDAPLMISGERLIPASACVVLPFKDDLKDWLTAAKTIAFQLKADQAQVYLPEGIDKDKAGKIWDKLSGDCRAEFIEAEQS